MVVFGLLLIGFVQVEGLVQIVDGGCVLLGSGCVLGFLLSATGLLLYFLDRDDSVRDQISVTRFFLHDSWCDVTFSIEIVGLA
jgi:hypothetical protein